MKVTRDIKILKPWFCQCMRYLDRRAFNAVPTRNAKLYWRRIIKYAACMKPPKESNLTCVTCRQIPLEPVCSSCGHTRCLKCVVREPLCVCGILSKRPPHVTITVQQLIDKIFEDRLTDSEDIPESDALKAGSPRTWPIEVQARTFPRFPMSTMMRLKVILYFIKKKKYLIAAAYLAIVANYSVTYEYFSKKIFFKIFAGRKLNSQLYMAHNKIMEHIKRCSAEAWIVERELECLICTETLLEPISLHCGHTICRNCLHRIQDTINCCPLCRSNLNDFKSLRVQSNCLIESALNAIKVLKPSCSERNIIPILACQLTLPGCIYSVVMPAYNKRAIRMICNLEEDESGDRKFGLVDMHYSTTIGTMASLRDCLMLPDGRVILTLITLHRFRIKEIRHYKGYHMARCYPKYDNALSGESHMNLFLLTHNVLARTIRWLRSLEYEILDRLWYVLGGIPLLCRNALDLYSDNGPSWLWWLIAAIPFHTEIKVLFYRDFYLKNRVLGIHLLLRLLEVKYNLHHPGDPLDLGCNFYRNVNNS